MARTTGASAPQLAAAMRREIYGEDLGQTGWRSAAEQVEIAEPARARPRQASARHRLRLRRPVPGAGRAHGMRRDRPRHRARRDRACPVGGFGARPCGPRDVPGARLRRPPPLPRRRLRRGALRRRDQSSAGSPGHAGRMGAAAAPGRAAAVHRCAGRHRDRSASPRSTSARAWASTSSCHPA